MPKSSKIYIGNTSVARLSGLVDEAGAYQNDATVTLESLVHRDTGAAVSNLTTPAGMSYVAASNGVYEVAIPNDVGVVEGEWYEATFQAISSSGDYGTWTEPMRAVRRIS